MRKQVGLKFEEEDVARWDVWAESQGLTRTELIETAVERLISAVVGQLPAEAREGPSGAAVGHSPRPGVRRAFICAHVGRDGVPDCNRRTFVPAAADGGFVPDCPEHGRMVAQPNAPYMGQSTK